MEHMLLPQGSTTLCRKSMLTAASCTGPEVGSGEDRPRSTQWEEAVNPETKFYTDIVFVFWNLVKD